MLMVMVGVVALNIAAARAFMECGWTGFVLIGFALQFGFLCWIRSRSWIHPFWLGFEAFGLASAITPITSMLFDSFGPDSWVLYIELVLNAINWACVQFNVTITISDDSMKYIYETSTFILQLPFAVFGGLLARRIGRLWSKRLDPVALGSAAN